MPWLRVLFLLTALHVTSGYRFRCYIACVDQTGTQNDYIEQRDTCREYAQLKVDMAMRESGLGFDDKNRKTQLVSLFSQCMGQNGWNVPDGKSGDGKKADAITSQAATAAPPSAAMVAATKAEEKSSMTRSAECAFARHSADVSSIARTRAEACDLECSQALKLAPGGPRPPSCAGDLAPKFSKGAEQ